MITWTSHSWPCTVFEKDMNFSPGQNKGQNVINHVFHYLMYAWNNNGFYSGALAPALKFKSLKYEKLPTNVFFLNRTFLLTAEKFLYETA